MKRFLLILAALSVSTTGFTANYFIEGMHWMLNILPPKTGPEDPVSYPLTMYIDGKEKIAGKTALKLWGIRTDINCEPQLVSYIYTEMDKVYFLSDYNGSSNGKWVLLYDFGLMLGESTEIGYMCDYWETSPFKSNIKCIDKEFKTSEGIRYRSMKILETPVEEDYHSEFTLEWIDGVGSIYGPDFNGTFFLVGNHSSRLLKAMLNNTILYDSGMSGVEETLADPAQGNAPRYKPDGTPFNDGDTGIYIQNGQKYIAR